MKTQPSGLKRILIIGALGVAAVVAIVMLTGGGSGNDSFSVAPMPGGDIAIGEDGDMGMGSDSIIGQTLSESYNAGKNSTGASMPVAPSTGGATRDDTAVTNGTAPDAGGSLLADDRKIVQTASMRLDVKEVGVSFEEVGRIATAAGGFVASSSFSNLSDSQVASVTVRVPSTSYQDVLSDFRALGVKVVAEDSKSSDVTAEYTDLGSRLRNLEATDTQLLALLGRATTITEILQVQDRLNGVRSEVEQVKGRMAMLDKLTDLATITVHLQPVAVGSSDGDGSRLGNEISAAWDNSMEFLTDVAAGIIHVVVFAWWVPLVGLPLFLIGSRLLRGRQRPISVVD